MTVSPPSHALRPTVPRAGLGAVVALGGCALLLARPWANRVTEDPTGLWIARFVILGPGERPVAVAGRPRRLRAATQRVSRPLGVAAFALGRALGGGWAPAAPVAGVVLLNSLAAVAEEAFFRRLLYGLLAPRGAEVAVVGSGIAFAAVHVTVWGAWVLPLDVAAGLLLSWQRWASGRWTVPAATHVAANVLAVI